MTTTLLLDLTQTEVRLLRRDKGPDAVLATAALDAEDFDAEIAALRQAALDAAGPGFKCAVRIPNSEILYTDIAAEDGVAPDEIARLVRAKLDGLTPYDVDELHFVWRHQRSSGRIHIAAVARQTLAEAEAFAVGHELNPKALIARAESAGFPGPVRFGKTAVRGGIDHAAALAKLAALRDAAAATADVSLPQTPETAVPPGAVAVEAVTGDAAPAQDLAPAPDPVSSETDAEKAAPPAPAAAPATDKPAGATAAKAETAGAKEDAPATAAADAKDAGTRDAKGAGETAAKPAPAPEAPPAAKAPAAETASKPPPEAKPAAKTPETASKSAESKPADKAPAPKAAPPQTPAAAATPAEPSRATDTPAMPVAAAGKTASNSGGAPAPRPPSEPSAPEGPQAAPAPKPRFDPVAAARANTGEAGAAARPSPGGKPEAPPPGERDAPQPAAGSRRGAAPVSFASRRASEPAGTEGGDPGQSPLSRIAARIAMLPDGGRGPVPEAPAASGTGPAARKVPAPAPTAAPKVQPPRRSGPGGPAPAGPRRGPARPPATGKPAAKAPPQPKVVALAPAGAAAAASLTPPTPAPTLPKPDTAPAPPRNGALTEAEAMTVFGARREAGSRARLSLLPVALGLVVATVLAIAIWSAYFFLSPDREGAPEDGIALLEPGAPVGEGTPLDDGAEVIPPAPGDPEPDLSQPAEPETAAAPVPQPEAPVGEGTPGPSTDTEVAAPAIPDAAGTPPAVGTGPDAAPGQTVAALDTPDTPDSPARPDTPPAGPVLDPLQRAAPPADSAARYAGTGVWEVAPEPPTLPASDRLDNVLAPAEAADPTPTRAEAPALADPTALAAVQPPASPLPPPPPGTGFDLGDDGLVVATPDGALSPEGIRVVAGAPPRRPPATPSRPAGGPPAEVVEAAPRVSDAGAGDPRPRPRPGSVDESRAGPAEAPVTLPQAPDAAPQALPPADTRLAGLRPSSRPEDFATRFVQALPAQVTVLTATPAAVRPRLAPTRPTDLPVEVPVAVVAPPTPEVSPEAIEAAVAAAVISPYAVDRSPTPASRPRNFASKIEEARKAAPAAATPVAAASVMTPRLPSSASVAKQATVRNALNMGKTALVGTYGSPSNKRALVRLSSGRFVKVSVGDRLEGGRVAAIGDGVLQYRKGSRRITLNMPQG
ncbi:hypothetical protein DXV76_07770 [Rhodobacteraceae bacterium CCMM004]|nr:hypothetical protein DXV76_07770 [Rhodobacteraceae bacterium CCMM004]